MGWLWNLLDLLGMAVTSVVSLYAICKSTNEPDFYVRKA
jgi:hypothetical protein